MAQPVWSVPPLVESVRAELLRTGARRQDDLALLVRGLWEELGSLSALATVTGCDRLTIARALFEVGVDPEEDS